MRLAQLAYYALFTASLVPAIAYGQIVPGGPSGLPPNGCTIITDSSPLLRSEGITEAVSDLVITCTGGSLLAPDQPVPQVNITVSMATAVTSRPLNGNVSEALLLIDEPNSGLPSPVPGFGPAEPFTICATPQSGCPAWAQQVTIGANTYAVAVNSATASASSSNAAPNVYQGVVSGNQVTFYGVPVLPAGENNNTARVFRITNIRINASQLTPGTAAEATVSSTDPIHFPLLGASQTVGSTQVSLSTSANSTQFATCASSTLQQATLLSYRDLSNLPLRTRLYLGPTDPVSQDIPGISFLYSTESDFTLAIPGSATAGLADFGTRVKAVFNNVPAGVHLFVSATNVIVGDSPASLAGAQAPFIYAQMVTGETTPYAVPPTSAQIPGTSIEVVEITPPAGSHIATAVWEVVNSVSYENIQFAVYVSYTANSVSPGDATVNLSYAPTGSTTTIPRFVDISMPLPAFTVNSGCQSPSAVTLTASPNSSVWGQSVTLTATVNPGATGTVSFFEVPNISLGSPVTINGTTAAINTRSLAVGNPSIYAIYSGDINFLGSNSGYASLIVNKAATTTVVTPSPDRSSVTVTITANSPASGIPSGTVSFYDGSTWLGTANVVDQGNLYGLVLPFDVTTADASITAVYSGDAHFYASGSATVPLHGGPFTCAPASSNFPLMRSESITELTGDVAIECAGGAPLTPGQPIPRTNITLTLPAPVTNRLLSDNASDALLLLDEPNSSLLQQLIFRAYVPGFGPAAPFTTCGTPLTGCAAWAQPTTGLYNQTYQVAVDSPTANATAANAAPNVYQGVVNGSAVTFYGVPILPPVVGPRILRITNVRIDATLAPHEINPLISASNPSILPITGEPFVSGFAGPSLTTSAASTAIPCDSQGLQQAAILDFTETSAFDSNAFKPLLDPTFPVQNLPDVVYKSESGLLVPLASGATAGLADFGTRLQAVFHNVPAGVRLFVSLTNVTTNSSGVVTGVPYPNGLFDTSHAFADLTFSETTTVAAPTVQASTSNVTLVEITPPPGSTTATAVWEVSNEGIGLFSTETLQFAVFVIPSTPSSSTITANLSYAPNGSTTTIPRFADTSSPVSAINISCPASIYAPPVLTLTSNNNPSVYGQPVTFTASVTPPSPAGPAQFYDGTTLLGSANLTNNQASFTTSTLSKGSHAIVATYNGLSTSFGQVVNGLAPSVTLTTITVGQSLTLTAQLGPTPPSGVSAPTGQVEFRNNGFPIGAATIANAAASLTISNLTAGPHSFLAIYSGDQYWAAGHSATLNITVSAVPTTSTLFPSLTNPGQATLTAIVTSQLGAPTGTVQFIDGSTKASLAIAPILGGHASTTFSSDQLTVSGAIRPIAATYSGDSQFASSSASLPAVLNAASLQPSAIAPDELVTANKLNFVVASSLPDGLNILSLSDNAGDTLTALANIARSAPGLFSANGTGRGPAAGSLLRVAADGTQTTQSLAKPIDASSPTDQLFVTLYATGLRHATTIQATINGIAATVLYAGPQPIYPGVDQVNLQLPSALAGAGTVNVVITADGNLSNAVSVTFQ